MLNNEVTSLSKALSGSVEKTSSFDVSKVTVEPAPFRSKGTEEQKKRISDIVTRLSQSPSARKELQDAYNFGYSICMEKGIDSLGYHEFGTRTVMLNENVSDDKNIATLAHEIRHVRQYFNKVAAIPQSNEPKTEIISDRSTEADAEAAAAIATWELKEQGDEKPWKIFKDTSPKIASAFEKNIGENTDKARTEAFLAWYQDIKRREKYDGDYTDYLENMKDKGLEYKVRMFRVRSAKDIIDRVCLVDGKNYFQEKPEILETEKFIAISERNAEKIKDFIRFKFDSEEKAESLMKEIDTYKEADKKKDKKQHKAIAVVKKKTKSR